MYDKQKVIDWAYSQIGYHEGPNNWNKYAEHLDSIPGFFNGKKQCAMWCGIFVCDAFVCCYGILGAKELLCLPDNSLAAGCLYAANYFKNKGQFFKTGPQTGDQIFFSYRQGEVSHTGLVVEVNATTVTTVEGNSSDMVAKRTYSINDPKIYGYGRPDWDGSVSVDVPQVAQTESKKPYKYHITQYPVTLNLLRRGDYGAQVVDMQAILNAKGFNCDVDGQFGIETENALKSFQRAVGLIDDGEYGGQSMNALFNY